MFCLVVDDFGVQYTSTNDVDHLAMTLKELYDITSHMTGTKYLGLNIDHDVIAKTLSISMPKYISKVMERFGIPTDGKATHSPAPYESLFGHAAQNIQADDTPLLAEDKAKQIEQLVGCLLFYARAVDSTFICDTNRLGSQQARPTERTYKL